MLALCVGTKKEEIASQICSEVSFLYFLSFSVTSFTVLVFHSLFFNGCYYGFMQAEAVIHISGNSKKSGLTVN
jgi:hypothetical protein